MKAGRVLTTHLSVGQKSVTPESNPHHQRHCSAGAHTLREKWQGHTVKWFPQSPREDQDTVEWSH